MTADPATSTADVLWDAPVSLNAVNTTQYSEQFPVFSDDGSKLFIDDQLVVDHDGLHGASEKLGEILLQQGKHRIDVEFFEKGGDEKVELYWETKGIKKSIVPVESYSH